MDESKLKWANGELHVLRDYFRPDKQPAPGLGSEILLTTFSRLRAERAPDPEELAEDLFQDGLLLILTRLMTYGGHDIDDPRAYMHLVVRRVVTSWLMESRHRSYQSLSDTASAESEGFIDAPDAPVAYRWQLERSLARLPNPRHRELLQAELRGDSKEQIMSRLGIQTEGAFRKAKHDAIAAWRDGFKNEGKK